MSQETVQEVTSQPATPVAKTEESKSAGKMGMSDLARKLAGNKTPYAPFQPTPPTPAPVTEAAPAPSAEVKAEETKTEGGETPTETAKATETETEEVPSHETQTLDPKAQEALNRKIDKEVAKRYKLKADMEAKIAALESRLAESPQVEEKEVHVPVPSNVPLAEITTLEQLNSYRDALTSDIIEAEMLLHSDFASGEIDTKWGKMTKPALIAALTQAKKDERTLIPAREKFLTTRTQSQQSAHEEFPFLKDRSHPGYQMAQQALRDNPVLQAYPNRDYLVGMLVEGQLAVQARKAGKVSEGGKTPPKPKQKPTSGQSEIASDASPTRAPTGMLAANALQVERANIVGSKKSLGHKDFAKLLLANQRNRNSQ